MSRIRLKGARRVVVKSGTSVATRPDGTTSVGRLGHLVEQVKDLRDAGREVILVSSGSIGLGADRLGLQRPLSPVDRKACAATGQGLLMSLYDSLATRVGITCAQVLITEADFHQRTQYVELATTLERLLSHATLPIINENDVVVHQRRGVFDDNDRLAALVASNLDADALVILTDVDGIHTATPGTPGAERISVWDNQTVDFGGPSPRGTGGMPAKVEAARIAGAAGVPTVITTAFEGSHLIHALNGRDVGTYFEASAPQTRRRQWLAFASVPAGRIRVNPGAQQALVEQNASLLPVGVVGVEGSWQEGEVVELVGRQGQAFARGICARSSDDVAALIGVSGERPLVHRDRVVLLT